MDDPIMTRLRRVLDKHQRRLNSWVGLAQAITDANEGREGWSVDRRTLARLASARWRTVQLRMEQLLAINHFLVVNNELPLFLPGLSPIDAIAESLNVNFLVAANPIGTGGDAVARWDLKAVMDLMRTRLGDLHHQVRIWDITGPDNWTADDPSIVNGANVAIGSPVANHTSEVMLARMLGIAPMARCPIGKLPFYIVGAQRDAHVKSAFIRDRREVKGTSGHSIDSLDDEHRGIVIGKQLLVSTSTKDYGLLIGQRNPLNGLVQLVLCGLTGQATYQLASILQAGEPDCTFPTLVPGETHPPILLAVYELTLPPEGDIQDRSRYRVISYASAIGPTFLHHSEDGWHVVSSDEPEAD